MSKNLLNLCIFFLIFQRYIFQIYNTSNITNISFQQDLNKSENISRRKEKPMIIQTIYSDSISNNYYYTILYLSKYLIKQTYLIDTEIDVLSSPFYGCPFCDNVTKINFINYRRHKYNHRIKCGNELCDILPSNGCSGPSKYTTKTCSFLSTKLNGDGMRGYFIKEKVYFEYHRKPINENTSKVYSSHHIPIGFSMREFGNYRMQVDGVMGLNNNKNNFVNILQRLNIIKDNIFSICIGNRLGYLSMGGVIKTFHKSKINYIPLINSGNLFKIEINQLNIENDEKHEIKTISVIDTGTPISYFPNNIFKIIINDFGKFCDKMKNENFSRFTYDDKYGYCLYYKSKKKMYKQIDLWPKIFFDFNNTQFTWRPKDYFYRANYSMACLGINNHTFDHIILGSNFMRRKDFIFDTVKKRIGFARADCYKINLLDYNNKNKTNQTKDNETEKENEANNKNVDYVIKDDIEFIKGRKNELKNFKDNKDNKNLFKKIVFIIFISLIVFVVGFIVIVVIILYRIIYPKFEPSIDQRKQT